jgi:hypothetical protein
MYVNMTSTESALPATTHENLSPSTAHTGANPAESFDEDTEDDEKSLNGGIKPWDEGGVSDCGYNETFHSAIMKVGETIHKVVGAPTSKSVISVQKTIGNWFQELSYATRDLLSGGHDSTLHKDTADAIHTVMTGGGLPDEDDISDPGEKKVDPY